MRCSRWSLYYIPTRYFHFEYTRVYAFIILAFHLPCRTDDVYYTCYFYYLWHPVEDLYRKLILRDKDIHESNPTKKFEETHPTEEEILNLYYLIKGDKL